MIGSVLKNKIKMESDWPAIASKIGKKLENRIK